jgi:hypothetical protein
LLKDLTNQKFGRLTVIERAGSAGNQSTWKCLCECGNEKIVRSSSLRCGDTKSCGCLHKDTARIFVVARNKTHGGCGTTEYNTWSAMRQRCYNKNNPFYHCYGGRGITVCERWLNSFENFLSDLGKKPSSKHSLDRINVFDAYSPDNCKWSTPSEQVNNRRLEQTLKEIDRLRELVKELGGNPDAS